MADAKTINTRIVLRNDELSAWEKSEKQLLKGEVAFARLSGTNDFEMRIGTGDKTWNQLSDSNVVVPDSTKFYEKATLAELEAVAGKNGDIGVVKELIADGKYSYTAYRWDKAKNNGEGKEKGGWVALDGNYNASNVIFDSNIQAMYTFGKYTGTNAKPVEIPAAGQSVADLFELALTKVIEPTTNGTKPSITISGGQTLTGEIGTTALTTLPAVTLSYEDGAYTYGPEPTGAKLSSYAISCNIPAANGTWTTVSETFTEENAKGTSTIKTIAAKELTKNYTFLSTEQKITFSAYNCNYTKGNQQLNNLKQPSTYTGVIAAGKADNKSTSVTMTGYYPAYYAFTTTSPKSNPTALTANNGNVTVDGVTYTRELNSYSKTTFTTNSKWYELFYLVPVAKRTSTGWTGKDGNNVDLAVEAPTKATVTFKDGTTAEYNVYVVRNAAQYAATTCTMTFK